MSDETIYIERHPGDSITAEDWNQLQSLIRTDIETTAAEAADGVDNVTSATNANQLDGKSFEELTDEITKRVLASVQTESGYRKVFRILEQEEFDIIEHGLGNFPLVDVYKLEYFEVVCREDDRTFPTITTFYLHHSSEKRIRVADETGDRRTIDIQPVDAPPIGIPFVDMLAHYHVDYTDSTSLEDLEVEFWKAFFNEPNDAFDDNQYCHSPWFERCCRDQLDIATIKGRGDLNDIMFQVRAWKMEGGQVQRGNNDNEPAFLFRQAPTPANVGVAHLDLNRVAVWLKGEAIHSDDEAEANLPSEFADELKVLILLRV